MTNKPTYEELQKKVLELENKLLETKKEATNKNYEYKTFFKNCRQIKLIIDPLNGVIIDANNKASEFYGYSHKVIVGMNIKQINTLSNKKIESKLNESNSSSTYDKKFIFEHKLANGEIKTVQVQATPIKFDGKNVIHSIITDISEIIEQRKEIVELQANYKSIFENINEIYYKIDKNNKLLLISPVAYKLFGYDKNAVLKDINIYDLYQDKKDRNKYVEVLKKEGEVRNHIVNLKTKEGELITVSINSKKILDENGNYNGIVGVFKDVTEREERKNKFKQITTQLKQAQKIAKLGHWFIDFKEDTEIWSDEIYNILELHKNTKTTPTTFSQFIHPDDVKTENDNWIKALKTGKYNLSYRLIVNEKIKWINVNADIIFDKNNQPIECFGITHDITDKINTKLALSDSENKYKSIVNSTIDVIFSCDMFGRILYVNEQQEKLFGRTAEEVQAKLFSKYTPKKEIPKFLKELKNVFQNKEVKNLQSVIYHKDGREIPIELNGRVITQNGKLVAFGSIRDISTRITMQKELEASKEKYENLFEQTSISTILHNGTKILEVNEAAVNFFDANNKNEIIGKSLLIFVSKSDKKFVIERISKMINNENYKQEPVVEKLITLNKNIKYAEVFSKKYNNNNQKLILVSFNDITNKVKVEKELIQSEKRYRNLFENSTIPSVVHIEGKIVMANKAICKFSEHEDKNDLIGKRVEDFIHPDSREDNEKKMRRMLRKTKQFFIKKQKLLTVNKTVKIADISGFMFKLHGKIAIQISFNDMTEIIEIQEQLKVAIQEANESNKLKSEFLANMSHEIRTPMNAILGFSEILKSKLPENSQHKMFVDSIYSSGKNLLNLINDILDLSKIEAGHLIPQLEEIDLRSLIFEIQQIFNLEIKHKGLDFRIDIDKNIPQYLIMDYTRLNQIFFNLVGNATKFTEKGSIFITVNSLNNRKHYTDLIIKIIDTGIGIAKDQIDNIFDSFKQADGQNTRKCGGTGLGLAIVKKLVEIMNGTISVTSQKDKGSTFIIHLKDIEKGFQIQETKTIFDFKDIKFEKHKILIVEDIETNREVINAYLDEQNLEIQEAVNGKDALKKLESYQPELILMDIQMPKMNGYEATKIIKEKYKDIIVIALSAFAMNDQVEKYKNIFDDYITKPISEQDLFNVLDKYLKKTEKTEEINTNLKNEIKTELLSDYENIKNTLSIDETLDFSDKMITFGQKFDAELFIKQGVELKKATKNFQLEKMENILESLKNIIK